MKRCEKCGVDIADMINHCPVCGKALEPAQTDSQQFANYPNNKIWIDRRNLVLKILLFIALAGTILSIAVDLFFNRTLAFSWYVITGFALFFVCIYLPLKKHWSFSTSSTVVGITLCAYIVFLELYTQTFGWGVNYVLPFFLLAMSAYCCVIVFSRNYFKGFEFFFPLSIYAFLSTANFVVCYCLNLVIWPSFSCFLASITMVALSFVFRYRKVKRELEKSFFV